MSKIDEVAEAIRLKSCERGYPVHPNVVAHLAVAAIEAMREPVPDEKYAFEKITPAYKGAWAAMIDAALVR